MRPNAVAGETFTLKAGAIEVDILTFGARLQSVRIPDRDGRPDDVTLGYDSPDDYRSDPYYLGATIGRVANRIAAGRFRLDGTRHNLPVNNGPNSLHGGTIGFDRAIWRVVETIGGDTPSVTLSHVSPDGDQGYPGALTVSATYMLSPEGVLSIDYTARTDRTTVVNLTNHAYWNLAGEGSADGAMGHELTLFADTYLPTDGNSIPTGEVRAVAGTPFDFRQPTIVGQRVRDGREPQLRDARGYDHNWIVAGARTGEVRPIARLVDPRSGRGLELSSDQPGLQVYTSNYFDGTVQGRHGQLYRQGDGIALEPQAFPDTPNQPAFGSIRLDPGQTYRNRIRYRFFAE